MPNAIQARSASEWIHARLSIHDSLAVQSGKPHWPKANLTDAACEIGLQPIPLYSHTATRGDAPGYGEFGRWANGAYQMGATAALSSGFLHEGL